MTETWDGLHILHADSPNSWASKRDIFCETFSTILHVAKWYFAPAGVLYTSCPLTDTLNKRSSKTWKTAGISLKLQI